MALLLSTLRVFLGLLFMVLGAVKLTDQISAEVHAHAKREFVKFAKVFPLKDMDITVDPSTYLTAVGWIEIVAGFLLTFSTGSLQELSTVVLAVLMMVAIYSLLMLQEPLSMCMPSIICFSLLMVILNANVREINIYED